MASGELLMGDDMLSPFQLHPGDSDEGESLLIRRCEEAARSKAAGKQCLPDGREAKPMEQKKGIPLWP